MSYWIFKCNPDHYRLTERLADPNPNITWTVSRYRDQIDRDDTVFVWETGDKRGIRAVLRITAAPQDIPELESEQQYLTERDTTVQCRVLATITHRNLDLSADELRQVVGLENLSVFHGFQQRANFLVTPAEGSIIERELKEQTEG